MDYIKCLIQSQQEMNNICTLQPVSPVQSVSFPRGKQFWWFSAAKWSRTASVCQLMHTAICRECDRSWTYDTNYGCNCLMCFKTCMFVFALRVTSLGTACQEALLASSPSPCKASQNWRGFVSRMWPSSDCFGVMTWAATSPFLNVLPHTDTHTITGLFLSPKLLFCLRQETFWKNTCWATDGKCSSLPFLLFVV